MGGKGMEAGNEGRRAEEAGEWRKLGREGMERRGKGGEAGKEGRRVEEVSGGGEGK